jgi:hypothetical protein
MRQRTNQVAFTVGEVDTLLVARSDMGDYSVGCKRLRDFSILVQGAARRRPATRYRATLAGKGRVIPFVFASGQEYLVVLRDLALDVYDTLGNKLQTIAAPWPLAQLWQVTYDQAADTMFLWHPNHEPQRLLRTGATTFTLTGYTTLLFLDANGAPQQPYHYFATPGVTLTFSGTTGSVTVTASAAVFTALHVNTWIRCGSTTTFAGATTTTWTPLFITAYTDAQNVTATVYGAIPSSQSPILSSGDGSATVFPVPFAFKAAADLSVSIGGVAKTLNTDFTVQGGNGQPGQVTFLAAPPLGSGNVSIGDSTSNAGLQWEEQAWSGAHGYPRCGAFHEQRLWMASTIDLPTGFWGSVAGQFFDFDAGNGEDDRAIWEVLVTTKVTEIRHLVSHNHLMVYTDLEEGFINVDPATAITPSNTRYKKCSRYGAGYAKAAILDDAPIFVQRTGTAVRESMFQYLIQKYTADAVSNRSASVLRAPLDMAVLPGTSDRPEQYGFIVNADGTMAVYQSIRAEKLAGWSLWTPAQGGLYQSIATTVEGIWVTVQRGAAWFLEQFDAAAMLDCSVALTSGTPATHWTGFAWLNGMTASVVGQSNTEYAGDYVVSGGALTLDAAKVPLTQADVGLNFAPVLEVLPIANKDGAGALDVEMRRISRITVTVDSALSLNCAGTELQTRSVADDMAGPPAAQTGAFMFHPLGYSRRPTAVLTQTVPLPLTVLAMSVEVSCH